MCVFTSIGFIFSFQQCDLHSNCVGFFFCFCLFLKMKSPSLHVASAGLELDEPKLSPFHPPELNAAVTGTHLVNSLVK